MQAHLLAGRLHGYRGDLEPILNPSLRFLPAPQLLRDSSEAAVRLADAIEQGERIGLVTDYDVDGITSHVVLQQALTRYFGVAPELVQSFVGHRLEEGYGISPLLAERILTSAARPDLIVSADCGSSDEERLQLLLAYGIEAIVTDHHGLPVDGPPASALATLNPTRADCTYPDKGIAGCMVAWLLMSELRRELVARGHLPESAPKLGDLLSYVALGTVADCVSLGESGANRAVVRHGLSLINRFDRPAWRALRRLLGDAPIDAETLAFQIGPRINARSRLAAADAALGFLLAENDEQADELLAQLDGDNRQRRAVEQEMAEQARRMAEPLVAEGRRALVIHLPDGHPGVQGIVASRLVERFGRPSVVLCGADTEAKGSARSVEKVHLRDLLQRIHEHQPELLPRFGGHKGAAGLSVPLTRISEFAQAFEDECRALLSEEQIGPRLYTDGEIAPAALTLALLDEIAALAPFGRGFESPLFLGEFRVDAVRVVGRDGRHLQLQLGSSGAFAFEAIWFRALPAADSDWPVAPGDMLHCAYRVARNEFRGRIRLQLCIEYGSAS